MLEPQNEHFVRDCLKFSHFELQSRCFPTSFLMNLKICYLKFEVSCEASANFHHMSPNATPATEFERSRHLTQPWHSDSQKTRNTTRLKCCACHAKWWRRSPKYCACHENCNSSSKNDAKVLRLPHKNDFRHVMKHVGMSRSEATRRLKPPEVTAFAELAMATAILPSQRSLTDGCKRLCGHKSSVGRTHLNPQTPEVKRQPFAMHLGMTVI